MLVRTPKSRFTLANLMRAQFSASLGALKIGMDILTKEEHAKVLKLYGHGGFFKTPIVGQRLMAAAMETPISVMETAGEGGAWGIALLAAYMAGKKDNEALGDYLSERVFAGNGGSSLEPVKEDVEGFLHFMEAFKAGLFLEREAAAHVGM